MKTALTILAVICLFGSVVAIKSWQYNSCRADGLSAGTCMGIISK